MRCVFIQESRSCESLDQVRLLNVSLQLKHSFIHRLWPLYCMCAAHGQTTTHKTYLAGRSGHKMINQPTESEQPHTLHLHLGSSQILKKSFPLSLYWVQLSPQFTLSYQLPTCTYLIININWWSHTPIRDALCGRPLGISCFQFIEPNYQGLYFCLKNPLLYILLNIIYLFQLHTFTWLNSFSPGLLEEFLLRVMQQWGRESCRNWAYLEVTC